MEKFEKIKNTVCYDLWKKGIVTSEELNSDIEFGRIWPRSSKGYYQRNAIVIRNLYLKYVVPRIILSGFAISYIKLCDMFMRKKIGNLAWIVPLLMFLPGAFIFLGIYALYTKRKNEDKSP